MQGNLFLSFRNKNQSRKDFANVQISRISPNPDQPRRVFDQAALIRLADSIREHGVLQPLAVREAANGYILVAGERRLRAATMAGLTNVPCIIISDAAGSSAELAVIENILREDLTMFEEAESFALLIADHGYTQEEVAQRLSCSQSYVANKIRLLKLTPSEREIVIANSLTERHARALLRIKDTDQRALALAYIIRRKLNVAQAEEYVDALLALPQTVEVSRQPREKIAYKDIKLFYNSIDHAIDLIRKAGVDAKSTRTVNADTTEIIISVPNRRA